MKNLLIIICLTLGFASCGPTKAELEAKAQAMQDSVNASVSSPETATVENKAEVTTDGHKVIEIDGCEYILWPQLNKYFSVHDNHTFDWTTYVICHKGNCKNHTNNF